MLIVKSREESFSQSRAWGHWYLVRNFLGWDGTGREPMKLVSQVVTQVQWLCHRLPHTETDWLRCKSYRIQNSQRSENEWWLVRFRLWQCNFFCKSCFLPEAAWEEENLAWEEGWSRRGLSAAIHPPCSRPCCAAPRIFLDNVLQNVKCIYWEKFQTSIAKFSEIYTNMVQFWRKTSPGWHQPNSVGIPKKLAST